MLHKKLNNPNSVILIHIIYSFYTICCNGEYLEPLYEGQSCTDLRTQAQGCCKTLHSCPSALQDLKNKLNITTCSYDNDIAIVCCKELCSITFTTEQPYIWDYESIFNWGSERNSDQLRISEKKCIEYSSPSYTNIERRRRRRDSKIDFNIKNEKSDLSPSQAFDGSELENDGEAVGGEDTKLYEFPHMAALGWYTNDGKLVFYCGGSLISEKFVLTAGHCISTPTGTTLNQSQPSIVRLGEHNIMDGVFDNASPIDIPIKAIIKHPQYKAPKKYYDIALIKLKDNAPRNSRIWPACLWSKDNFGQRKTAIVTGWGTTVSGGTENSPILQKVTLDIIDNKKCDALLHGLRNRHWDGFKDHQMCAGVLEGGKDACQGDSGGPLQVQLYNALRSFAVIGVTSFGKQCAKPNQPGVYTKVSYFLDWIEPIVWPETKN